MAGKEIASKGDTRRKKGGGAARDVSIVEVRDFSARNSIDSIAVQNRLNICPFETHDGIPAASKLVIGNTALTHVGVQRARGNVKEFSCLGFVEQPLVIRSRILHKPNHGGRPQPGCSRSDAQLLRWFVVRLRCSFGDGDDISGTFWQNAEPLAGLPFRNHFAIMLKHHARRVAHFQTDLRGIFDLRQPV